MLEVIVKELKQAIEIYNNNTHSEQSKEEYLKSKAMTIKKIVTDNNIRVLAKEALKR